MNAKVVYGGRVQDVNSPTVLRDLTRQGAKIVGGDYPEEFKQFVSPELAREASAAGMMTPTEDPRPAIPEAFSTLDENGNLKSQYKLGARGDVAFASNLKELNDRLSGINLNKEGLEAIRKRALTQGPSEWQNLMLQKQGLEESGLRDRAGNQEASARSGAYSQLAAKGGLSTGARERLARSGAEGLAQTMQDISRGGAESRLGIATEDERQKLDLLKGLPGMEVQALQPEFEKTRMWGTLADSESGRKQNLDLANRAYGTSIDQFNIANTLGEVGRKDANRLGEYQEKMKAYAAEKQAQATAASGGGKK